MIGVTASVAQVIVPMSSTLAADHERGRVVGTVMSGLLIGILLARTFSGLVAAAFGWRTVFVAGAAVMLVLAGVLWRALPKVPPMDELTYGGLLRSVLNLVREEPMLRQRMLIGFLDFGCFSALWTSVAFLLSGPPVQLRQCRHRTVRPGRRGRGGGRHWGRAALGPRPRRGHRPPYPWSCCWPAGGCWPSARPRRWR